LNLNWNVPPTNANNANAIVKRDGNGNFSAGSITAVHFIGDGSMLTNLPGGGGGGGGTVTSVGLTAAGSDFVVTGSPVTGNGTLNLNWNVPPTSDNAPNSIVKRDANGTISVGTVSAQKLFGDGSGILNLPTGITSVGLAAPSDFSVSGSPLTANGTLSFGWNVAPTTSNFANAIVKRDASGNFNAGSITAFAGGTNAIGITAQGNGTGAGIIGTGGTSGNGMIGNGGTNGIGVVGNGGSSSGAGGSFAGGGPNGNGVVGNGLGQGSGGVFTGGSVGSNGVIGMGGGAAGVGVEGIGQGLGTGGFFVGGSSNGSGVTGNGAGTSGNGVVGSGAGSGNGIVGNGGSSNGDGVVGNGGGPGGRGVLGHGAGVSPGVEGDGGNNNAPGVRGSGGGTGSAGVEGIGGANGNGVVGSGTGSIGNGVIGTGSGTGAGIVGNGTLAGRFNGNVQITGTLTKGGGSFKIDHPLDPANKYLSHSFVESPDMMNIYNGNVVTDRRGIAAVVLPDYFSALNRDFRYQLTVIGEFAQAIVAEKINNNHFIIRTSKPNIEVSWQVTGIRQDAYANAHRIPVEEDKPAEERGHYLHPELFGQEKEKTVGWIARPQGH
jgi:hypothetical protein